MPANHGSSICSTEGSVARFACVRVGGNDEDIVFKADYKLLADLAGVLYLLVAVDASGRSKTDALNIDSKVEQRKMPCVGAGFPSRRQVLKRRKVCQAARLFVAGSQEILSAALPVPGSARMRNRDRKCDASRISFPPLREDFPEPGVISRGSPHHRKALQRHQRHIPERVFDVMSLLLVGPNVIYRDAMDTRD